MSLNCSQHIQYARYCITHGGVRKVRGSGDGEVASSAAPSQSGQDKSESAQEQTSGDTGTTYGASVTGTSVARRVAAGEDLHWVVGELRPASRPSAPVTGSFPAGQTDKIGGCVPTSHNPSTEEVLGERSCDWEVAGEATEKNLWFVHITTMRTLAAGSPQHEKASQWRPPGGRRRERAAPETVPEQTAKTRKRGWREGPWLAPTQDHPPKAWGPRTQAVDWSMGVWPTTLPAAQLWPRRRPG